MIQTLTDWLQQNRLVVVSVDAQTRRVRVESSAEACTDLSCSENTVVMSDDAVGGLEHLNAGDIVKLDGGTPDRPQRILVVRRVWEVLTSPEF